MNKFRLFALLMLAATGTACLAQREDHLIDDNWKFRFSHDVERGSEQRVDLPHTWNTTDALSGKRNYKRGIGNYERTLDIRPEWTGRRLFLRFEGAGSTADIFIDGRHVGQHLGGYGAFVIDITPYVKPGQQARLLVRVSNAERLDLMPLVGDFNFYGGLYRDVHLLVTPKDCIAPDYLGSSGVVLRQDSLSDNLARLTAHVRLSLHEAQQKLSLRVRVTDGNKVVAEASAPVLPTDTAAALPFSISKPHLWDGRRDPFRYRTTVQLLCDGKVTDSVTQPLGLRSVRIDPNEGFFLNGRHLALHGVCRHQDRAEVGNALLPQHHDEDARIMAEMGVNAVRLAHYPQAEHFYDLMDSLGIVVWAEIPFVGPGGYLDKGYVDSEAFHENGFQQLRELILQHGNHPSICMWGLFNELKEQGDNPCGYIARLNDLAHALDPTRPTTAASNQQGKLNFITDLIAWNRYDGWYGGSPADLGRWLDQTHKNHPELRIAISEYGAGASIRHQQDTLMRVDPTSWWHPENWQTWYHMENWRQLSARPFVWGTFVWNMFDFGAAHRHEGDRPGINDKGLVTFDRSTRKDAFYFYQANWRDDIPVLHLADRRCTRRTRQAQTFTAFTNLRDAELFIDGRSLGHQQPDEVHAITWQADGLTPGQHEVKVVARSHGRWLSHGYRFVIE